MDTVINRLSEIEAAAGAIVEEANARKKAFAEEMEDVYKRQLPMSMMPSSPILMTPARSDSIPARAAKEMGMATRTMPANRERICPLMMSPPSFFCTDFE